MPEFLNLKNYVVVRVWLPHRFKDVGHTSLETRSHYISFWPAGESKSSSSTGDLTHGLKQDIEAMGYKPEVTIILYSLNTDNIDLYYEEIIKLKTPRWLLTGQWLTWQSILNNFEDSYERRYGVSAHSCATLVYKLLVTGGIKHLAIRERDHLAELHLLSAILTSSVLTGFTRSRADSDIVNNNVLTAYFQNNRHYKKAMKYYAWRWRDFCKQDENKDIITPSTIADTVYLAKFFEMNLFPPVHSFPIDDYSALRRLRGEGEPSVELRLHDTIIDGQTKLHQAILAGNETAVRDLWIRYPIERNRLTGYPDRHSLLHLAVKAGALSICAFLLEQNYFYVDCINGSEQTPLSLAIESKNKLGDEIRFNLIKCLLAYGANPYRNRKQRYRWQNSLFAALYLKDFQLVRYLWDRYPLIRKTHSEFGENIIHAYLDDLPMLKYIFTELLTDPSDRAFLLEEPGILGKTPVWCCVKNNIKPFYYLLKAAGANLRTRDDNGNTLLHVCKDAEIINDLLSAGLDINTPNNEKETPLHTAASDKALALFLLERGANPMLVNNKNLNILFLAYQNRNISLLKHLWKNYPALRVTITSQSETLLHLIGANLRELRASDSKLAIYLLQHGADPMKKDDFQRNILFLAYCWKNFTLLTYLWEHYPLIRRTQSVHSKTLLHLAVKDSLEMLDRFLVLFYAGSESDRHFLLETPDDQGNTPICLILENNQYKEERFAKLVKAGANLQYHDTEGNTLFHKYALRECPETIITTLISKVNITAKNTLGQNPLHKAVSKENLSMIIFLLNHSHIASKDKKRLMYDKDNTGKLPLDYAIGPFYNEALNIFKQNDYVSDTEACCYSLLLLAFIYICYKLIMPSAKPTFSEISPCY
jgi:ankyrin repeat protein